jgi:type IV pilus assembly protein PilV
MLLIEVLVSLLIAAIALLGTVSLMAKSTRSEMESYQRVQALTLLQDMVSRINANRQVATCYSAGATGVIAGTGATAAPACATGTATQIATVSADLTAWNNALLGAGEVSGGNKVGAMIGAIGCIDQLDPTNNIYRITVVWQGLMPTVTSKLLCGQNKFGNENLRRAVSVDIRIASLSS